MHVGDVIHLDVAALRYALRVEDVGIAGEGPDVHPIMLYSMRNWRWRYEPFADGTYLIGEYGCALCLATMVASQLEPYITPPELDQRLVAVDGYCDSELRWEKVPEVVAASPEGVSLVYDGPMDRSKDGPLVWRNCPADMDRVHEELEVGPCGMQIDYSPGGKLQSHFVLAMEFTPSEEDICIYDPWDGARTLLLQRYAQAHWDLGRAIYGLRLLRLGGGE